MWYRKVSLQNFWIRNQWWNYPSSYRPWYHRNNFIETTWLQKGLRNNPLSSSSKDSLNHTNGYFFCDEDVNHSCTLYSTCMHAHYYITALKFIRTPPPHQKIFLHVNEISKNNLTSPCHREEHLDHTERGSFYFWNLHRINLRLISLPWCWFWKNSVSWCVAMSEYTNE